MKRKMMPRRNLQVELLPRMLLRKVISQSGTGSLGLREGGGVERGLAGLTQPVGHRDNMGHLLGRMTGGLMGHRSLPSTRSEIRGRKSWRRKRKDVGGTEIEGRERRRIGEEWNPLEGREKRKTDSGEKGRS